MQLDVEVVVKIAAKPIDLPKSSEINVDTLSKTEAGKYALQCIQEAIEKKCLQSSNVSEFLKKWDTLTKKEGTCEGQSKTVMIAKGRHKDKSEKTLLKAHVKIIDTVAYQLLRELSITYGNALENYKMIAGHLDSFDQAIKIVKKMLNGTKNNAEERNRLTSDLQEQERLKNLYIKQQEKALKKAYAEIGHIAPSVIQSAQQAHEIKQIRKNISKQTLKLIEKRGNLQLVSKEKFSNKDSFHKKIKELLRNKSKNYSAQLYLQSRTGSLHCVALFFGKTSSLYDSLRGFTQPQKSKKFINTVKQFYTENKIDIKKKVEYKKFKIEIFKQRNWSKSDK